MKTRLDHRKTARGLTRSGIKELCDLILKLKESDLKVTYRPYSAEDARRLVQNRIGSPDKAERDLGFRYKDSLREGLLKLIEWREENGKLKAQN